jgi:hypothetical protein
MKENREDLIEEIIERETDGLSFEGILFSLKSYRRNDLQGLDDDTLQNILDAYNEETSS